MDYKYSFVCNSTPNGLYALVMNCWYINEEGVKIDVKSEIKTDITLDDAFVLAKQFVG